ncbi:MAG TPA: hypothetical protein PKK15_20405, partial [Kouleothrix sp.]|nr:hypothetical protein [Kouleothrix sp.]
LARAVPALLGRRRAPTPVRLPAALVGAKLVGLAGTADLWADGEGMITLPADGPAFGMWQLNGM